ncbi:DUF3108 domain-containing protein [Geomonas propionica]|uniref:DUF3108 domain-containing protein n=1 Tax=Geomonas propionica TaxID=2798582 RepID=A0ABS0YRG5_9BACT|nr:DUF3108 domain-containing protein [Geomonas propionica]MBJ6800539.1 DUF3108 domain-containing protein [Geomonas propionica]
MMLHLHKNRIAPTCIVFSVVAHLVLLLPFWKYGRYDFGNPVRPLQAVMVDLAQASPKAGLVRQPKMAQAVNVAQVQAATATMEDHPKGGNAFEPQREPIPFAAPKGAAEPTVPRVPEPRAEKTIAEVKDAGMGAPVHVLRKTSVAYQVQPPLRQVDEFLAAAKERLTYQISMFNLPVGSAELEAKRENGEVRFTLKVKSSPALSGIYPVDDLVETRHIGGNYILTRIQQREGSFRSDRGFTLMLRDKKVFWIDRLTSRSSNETIPSSDVTDIISGLYYLRNRPLEVSETETLHVYDSDTYTDLPIQVLRRERIDLPGFRKLDTIVIKPLLKTEGIFKRTGEVTIWLTDDVHRVPVKVETQISLGKVTVALIASDTETDGAASEAVSAKADTE